MISKKYHNMFRVIGFICLRINVNVRVIICYLVNIQDPRHSWIQNRYYNILLKIYSLCAWRRENKIFGYSLARFERYVWWMSYRHFWFESFTDGWLGSHWHSSVDLFRSREWDLKSVEVRRARTAKIEFKTLWDVWYEFII